MVDEKGGVAPRFAGPEAWPFGGIGARGGAGSDVTSISRSIPGVATPSGATVV